MSANTHFTNFIDRINQFYVDNNLKYNAETDHISSKNSDTAIDVNKTTYLHPNHLSEIILVDGADSTTFLHSMLSNDVKNLTIGQAQPNLICDSKGRILFPIILLKFNETGYYIVTAPSNALGVGKRLKHYHVREDFKMHLVSDKWMQLDLIGEQLEQVLSSELLAGLLEQHFDQNPISISAMYPLGSSDTNQKKRCILLIDKSKVEDLMNILVNDLGLKILTYFQYEFLRISQLVPKWKVDFTEGNFPKDAHLENHISYNKGCYIGQEPHNRMHHQGHPNKQIIQFALTSEELVKSGESIIDNKTDKKEVVGQVTSITVKDKNNTMIGLAMVQYKSISSPELILESSGLKIENLNL